MKKYLMTAMAAVAMGVAFTSCSHNTDLYGGEEGGGKINGRTAKEQIELDKAVYKAAFEQSFGKVAPTVDWGFGGYTRSTTRALGDYDAYLKGDLTVDVSFPSDCDASNFNPDLDGVKSYKEVADAANQGGGFGYGICYIDENHTGKVHIWGEYGKRVKLYIKEGTYDFTNETFDLCADADLYLLSGATVTLNNTAASTAKFDVYIASGAKLIANGENGFRADVDAHVYNHGTIECTRFEVNVTSSLYNVGTLKVPTGDVYIANNNSKIVNDGTINSASVHVEGSGALQNNAEWTVTGKTVVNCNSGGWVNNGHWTTQNYHYTAGSNNVINNCFLEVKNDFYMNFGSGSYDFKINSGGGVLTKNFYGGGAVEGETPATAGPFKITMGAKSLFKVTNECYLDATASGIATYKYGFEGVGVGEENAAVLQAKYVRNHGVPGHGYVAYSGNFYVSAEEHFAQGTTGASNGASYILFKDGCSEANIYAPGFENGKPDITIDETPCNPGFKGDGDEPETYRVIAEDYSASDDSDFDFNDVVFNVDPDDDGNGATITVLAAGGIWPLTINGEEVHTLLGYGTKDVPYTINGNEYLCYPMINTGVGAPKGASTSLEPTIQVTGDYSSDEAIRASINAIEVKVFKYDDTVGTILPATIGEAACKILVDQDCPINSEYETLSRKNSKFREYVGGTFHGKWWK